MLIVSDDLKYILPADDVETEVIETEDEFIINVNGVCFYAIPIEHSKKRDEDDNLQCDIHIKMLMLAYVDALNGILFTKYNKTPVRAFCFNTIFKSVDIEEYFYKAKNEFNFKLNYIDFINWHAEKASNCSEPF